MKKYLVTVYDISNTMWIKLNCETRTIIIEGINNNDYINEWSDKIILDTYSFDNINEFINKYGEGHVICFHALALAEKFFTINKRNINKLIEMYKKYNNSHIIIIYLHGYKTLLLTKRQLKNTFYCIEKLKII